MESIVISWTFMLSSLFLSFLVTFDSSISVKATGHKTPGESLVILQIVVRVQLTSRRILRN